MISFAGNGILLDIEGTTSSIRFVYDVMFPFVRRELSAFLEFHWESNGVVAACDQIATDAGYLSLNDWMTRNRGEATPQSLVESEVIRLMDDDVKATGLKKLQGLIWKSGFESGELKAHLYDDVLECIQLWNARGIDVRIYSSGSVQAQKLFFGHTIQGDLLDQFRGHYDTTIGSKRESQSYSEIARSFELSAGEILFLSDVPAELDAARTAGMQTGLCVRPGNAKVDEKVTHAQITSFAQVELNRG